MVGALGPDRVFLKCRASESSLSRGAMMTSTFLLLILLGGIGSSLGKSMIDTARMNGGQARNHFSSMTPISTIEELSRDATLVVYGRVQATEARLSNDQGYIVTDLSVTPLRVYKGRVESPDRPGRSSPVVVKRVGGTVTVEGMRLVTTVNDLPDNEVLRVGEEAILFLIPDEEQPGRFVILGGSFGTMRVRTAGVSPQTRAAARRRGDTPKSFREFEQGLIALLRK